MHYLRSSDYGLVELLNAVLPSLTLSKSARHKLKATLAGVLLLLGLIANAAEAQVCLSVGPPNWPPGGTYDSAAQALSACEAVGSAVPFFNPSVSRGVTNQYVGCILDPSNSNFRPTYKSVGHRASINHPCLLLVDQPKREGPGFFIKQNCPDCVAPTKNLGPPSCDSNSHCGNPINAAIGNKYQRADDIFISSLLKFSLHYNSNAAAPKLSLGPRWSHTYMRSLHVVNDAGGVAYYVGVSRPEGGKIFFKNVSGVWTTEADVPFVLNKVTGQGGETLGWTYARRDALETEEYDSLGRLIRISGEGGDWVDLAYNGTLDGTPNDFLLTRVQARDGRFLDFLYTSGNLTSVTDPTGHAYTYAYDATGRLVGASYPDGNARQYHYNEQAHTADADLPYALTGITDESGQRYATFEYAADGRAVSTEHAGGVDKYAITYASDGSAEISGPNGETQIRAFKAVHGVKKASSVVENCVGCAPKTNLYTHDANGRYDIVTDAMGATTNYDYNARGLLSQKIESANVSAHKRTTQNDWHAEMPLLLERRTYDSASVLKEKITWAYNTRGQATTTTQFDPATNEVPFELGMRLPGQRHDPASSLSYNYFRDYDPGVGRYAESDPIGLGGGVSTYAYTINSPLMFIDPYGLETHTECVARYSAIGRVCGSLVGTIVGGTAGAAGGGAVCSPSGPGALVCAGGGAAQGAVAGGLVGGEAGSIVGGAAGGLSCPADGTEECHRRYDREEASCVVWRGRGPRNDPDRWYRACLARAAIRRNLCVANKGSPGTEPPEWSDADF